jgi:hypothetical protein
MVLFSLEVQRRNSSQEYIHLYKKKFNGPQSSFHWRRSLPPLTAEAQKKGKFPTILTSHVLEIPWVNHITLW